MRRIARKRSFQKLKNRRVRQFKQSQSADANHSLIGTCSRSEQIVMRVRYSLVVIGERTLRESPVEDFYILEEIGDNG